MINNRKNAFTLVELLAVLVILAVILIIAIPKVMTIIKDVRISTLESTAKLVALSAEKKKVENEIIGNNEILTCENVVKINDIDYENCYIEFIDSKAVVTIIGKGTFKGMNVCEATKTTANIKERCLNKKVEVTLELNGGIAKNISGIYKEGTIIDLEEPTKENSTFLEYKVVSGNSVISNNKLTVGSTNTIIYAFYESWPSLEVLLDEGTDNIDYNEKYKSGTIIELEQPTKTGYTFIGWTKESGNSVLSGNNLTMGNEDTVIKANYELNTYKVTFNPGDGIIDTTYKNVTYTGTYGEMPTPVKEGYMFIGWYNENNNEVISTDKVEILNGIELTAKYIKNEFAYTGNFETFIVPKEGNYKIELWGASGGLEETTTIRAETATGTYTEREITYAGGRGAYTKGEIYLNKNQELFIYVGEMGKRDLKPTFNGGGKGAPGGSGYKGDNLNYDSNLSGYSGGGATDIRLTKGDWNNFNSLKTRIMVAAGGGGSTVTTYTIGSHSSCAGGLKGYDGGYYEGHPYVGQNGKCGEQTKGGDEATIHFNATGVINSGKFGIGGNTSSVSSQTGAGGGGGGYYGGSGASGTTAGGAGQGGGGGSSFISGHNGCDAINESSTENNIVHTGQSIHYTYYKFTNTIMIDGDGYNWTNIKENYTGMPSYDGDNVIRGNIGNGYAKITYIGKE